jgi:hypothetical protein
LKNSILLRPFATVCALEKSLNENGDFSLDIRFEKNIICAWAGMEFREFGYIVCLDSLKDELIFELSVESNAFFFFLKKITPITKILLFFIKGVLFNEHEHYIFL